MLALDMKILNIRKIHDVLIEKIGIFAYPSIKSSDHSPVNVLVNIKTEANLRMIMIES